MITVCIPTIPSRRSLLSRALWSVPDRFEIIVASGEGAMGDKLNACFQAAQTSHVLCLDDDDMLLPGPWKLPIGPSFVGYRILYTEDGIYCGSVAHRGNGDTSWSTFDRGVSNKCIVDSDLARSHPFGNHYTADREWSQAVQQEVVGWKFIDAELYHYDHWNRHMVGTEPGELTERPQRHVGWWPYDESRVRWL